MTALAAPPPRPQTPRGVEAVLRRGADGTWVYRFRTRWKDPISRRRVVAELDTVSEVLDFRARLRVARARGEIAQIARGDRTITDYAEGTWWPRHVMRHLEANTRGPYGSVWRRHLKPHIGDRQLRHLTPPAVVALRELLYDLEVGEPTIARALVILQGICAHAVEAGEIPLNPVKDVAKPSPEARLTIKAPGAAQIEKLRRQLDPRSAALVSLIGYAGLRPSEALGLARGHLGRSTILIERRVINGQLVTGQKTTRGRRRPARNTPLYQPVREDLERYLTTARRGRASLLFPNDDGSPWSTYEYRQWREQIFTPAVKAAGVEIARPYDLRHGAASMRLHAGMPVTVIAAEMGHTVTTLSDYYAHEIEDLRLTDPVPVEQQIHDARSDEGAAMRETR